MRKFKLILYMPGSTVEFINIEARECIITENAYTFYGEKNGVTNHMVASYPIYYTIINQIVNI